MIRKLAHNNMEHIAGGNIWEIETPDGIRYYVEVMNLDNGNNNNHVTIANRTYIGPAHLVGARGAATPKLFNDLAAAVRIDREHNPGDTVSLRRTDFLPVKMLPKFFNYGGR